jgi:SAM-dependent methyltransferase
VTFAADYDEGMPDGTQPTGGIRASYDVIADEYARRIYGELKDKPFDRQWLEKFAERVGSSGWTCDLGCGPAQIARDLRDRRVRVFGLDLSFGMLRTARRLNPNLSFVQGATLALPLGSGSLSGLAAFYSIIHIERDQVVNALAEMRRVLRPGGSLLLAFHLGTGSLEEKDLWGYGVDFTANFFTSKEMLEYLSAVGFVIDEAVEREPYPEVEYQSRRAYIIAHT